MDTMRSPHDPELLALTVKFPDHVMDTLRDIATAKATDIDTLVSGYITNGIELDMPEVRRWCFFSHVKEILEKHNVPSEAIAEINYKFTF
jgi:hypothetical protein